VKAIRIKYIPIDLKNVAFLFENGIWEQERIMLESENDSSRNRDRFKVESEIESTHSQKPFANREDFEYRSWLTFKIDNTEIKNVRNGFFFESSLSALKLSGQTFPKVSSIVGTA